MNMKEIHRLITESKLIFIAIVIVFLIAGTALGFAKRGDILYRLEMGYAVFIENCAKDCTNDRLIPDVNNIILERMLSRFADVLGMDRKAFSIRTKVIGSAKKFDITVTGPAGQTGVFREALEFLRDEAWAERRRLIETSLMAFSTLVELKRQEFDWRDRMLLAQKRALTSYSSQRAKEPVEPLRSGDGLEPEDKTLGRSSTLEQIEGQLLALEWNAMAADKNSEALAQLQRLTDTKENACRAAIAAAHMRQLLGSEVALATDMGWRFPLSSIGQLWLYKKWTIFEITLDNLTRKTCPAFEREEAGSLTATPSTNFALIVVSFLMIGIFVATMAVALRGFVARARQDQQP